jgi:hypothetical protein
MAHTRHPWVYGEICHFVVTDISADGATMETSPRNGWLLRGTRLSPLELLIPTEGSYRTEGEIRRISKDRKRNRLVVGVRFLDLDPAIKHCIPGYVLRFYGDTCIDEGIQGGAILDLLRSAGFRPKLIRRNLDVGVVKSVEEYKEVLAVRLAAYDDAGKLGIKPSLENLADVRDLRSRILIARACGQIVGTLRVTFCNDGRDRFELEESINLPQDINRTDTAELSRLAVSPVYQGTDVVLGLIERAIQVGYESRVCTAITSCTPDRLENYKRLGFIAARETFPLKTMGGLPHYFLRSQVDDMILGRNTDSFAWHYTFKNVVDYLTDVGLEKKNSVSLRHRLAGALLLPLLQGLQRRRRGH